MRKIHPFTYSFTTCFKERQIVNLLADGPRSSILDVGCGTAYMFSVLSRAFPNNDYRYLGIDIESDAIEKAREFYGKDVDLRCGDVQSLKIADQEFQDVLYLDVIEHVPDAMMSLKELHRIMKPGGRLILSTPNIEAPLTNTFFCTYLHDDGHMANQVHGYSASVLSELLKGAGFVVKEVRYTNIFLTELLITMTKLGYRLKRSRYSSQGDVLAVESSILFALHKFFFFPLGYLIGRIEELLLGQVLRGHCMIISAVKS